MRFFGLQVLFLYGETFEYYMIWLRRDRFKSEWINLEEVGDIEIGSDVPRFRFAKSDVFFHIPRIA